MTHPICTTTRYLKMSDHTFEWQIDDFDNRMEREDKKIVSPVFAIPWPEGTGTDTDSDTDSLVGKFFLRVEEAEEEYMKYGNESKNDMKTPTVLQLVGSSTVTLIKWYFSVSLAMEGGDRSTKVAATLEIIKGEEVMRGSIGETHSFVSLNDPKRFQGTTGAKIWKPLNYSSSGTATRSSNFYTSNETSLLTLRATITTPSHTKPMTSLEAELEDTKHCNLRPLLTDPKYADVILMCQGKKFPCHRIILSSRSSVFEKMFDSKMVEAKSGTVVIEDMEADTLQRLLEFTYTGEVTDMQEVMELLYAADKYLISGLVRVCVGHLQKEVKPATVADILVLADRHNIQDLKQVVIKRVLSDKAWFMGNKEFKEKMNKELLLELLAHN